MKKALLGITRQRPFIYWLLLPDTGCAPVVSSLPPPSNLRKPYMKCNEPVRMKQVSNNPSPKIGHVDPPSH